MRIRTLPVLAIGLSGLLIVQTLDSADSSERVVSVMVSFAEAPQSMEEAAASAQQVVLGRVTRVRRGPDVVVPVPGEPSGEDRISIEIATVQVDRAYKAGQGGPPQSLEIQRPGIAGEGESVAAEEDPPYRQGERYVLFVKPGLRLGGQQLQRIVAPAGRYRIRNDGTVEPMARGTPFAEAQRGRSLDQLEEAVNRGVGRSGGKGKGGG
jgi:hypothetical protein